MKFYADSSISYPNLGTDHFQILKCLACQYLRLLTLPSQPETRFQCQAVYLHRMAMHKVEQCDIRRKRINGKVTCIFYLILWHRWIPHMWSSVNQSGVVRICGRSWKRSCNWRQSISQFNEQSILQW